MIIDFATEQAMAEDSIGWARSLVWLNHAIGMLLLGAPMGALSKFTGGR